VHLRRRRSGYHCRGAESAVELERQTAKEVAALTSLQRLVGVMEIENDGYGPDSAISTWSAG
jgi:predicted extracellular nuclease